MIVKMAFRTKDYGTIINVMNKLYSNNRFLWINNIDLLKTYNYMLFTYIDNMDDFLSMVNLLRKDHNIPIIIEKTS